MDMHEAPVLAETWAMLDALLPRLPNVKALCYECEGMPADTVLSVLAQLRDKVRRLSASPGLVALAGTDK